MLLHCYRDGFWCGTWKLKFSGACKSGNRCRPCCSVRDVFFCKRLCSLQTIGHLKKTLNLLKICSPRLCSSCITLTKSNVQIVLFAVALVWFNFCCDCSILCLSVWMLFFCCCCFLKIKLPWFFRWFCSTLSESHRIVTATAVPLLNNTLYLCFRQLFNTAESSLCFLVMNDVTWLWFNKKGSCAARASWGLINMYVRTNYSWFHL